MTKKDCRLVEKIIRSNVAFECNSIDYEVTGSSVRVWSTLYNSDSFYATEIIPLFIDPIQTLVTYDIDRYKCVLVIF